MALLGIDNDKLNDIKNQVKRNYPLECCGLLVGTNTSERKVVEVRQVENKNTDRTHDRYEIEGKEFMKVDKEAKKKGLQIIGIYHSHPDHPAVPSAFDTEHAWTGYSYLIIAIEKREKIDVKAWVFNDEKKQFEEEEIKLYFVTQ